MFTRTLGHSKIEVSAMGLGCWAIGGPFNYFDKPAGWGGINDEDSIRAIHRGLDLGVTFFDTANVYGCGHSEEILAKALEGRRDKVVIATKFGNTWDPGTKNAYAADPITPEEIRRELEGSLRRLKTDCIDLYQFHLWGFPAADAVPVRETLEALVAEGKIRGYGWSTDLLENVQVFAEGPHCIATQQQLNVIEGHPGGNTNGILALCEARNLASLNRAPLAMGLLTGKFTPSTTFAADDVRSEVEWFGGFQGGKPNPEWLTMLEALREILTSNGRTLAQGALAWLWGRSDKTIPIPGFKTIQQAEDNAHAMEFGPLTADQMREIDVLLNREPAAS
jgi:aryl-alcohol dehydrogenase-like predicted oxidoreductase